MENVPSGKRKLDHHDSPGVKKQKAEIADPNDAVNDLSMATPDSWARPALDDFDPSKRDLVFQNVDMDYFNAKKSMKGTSPTLLPIIRVYGVDSEGHSLVVHVYNFRPYFYVKAWDGFDLKRDMPRFCDQLDRAIRGAKNVQERCVTSINPVKKSSIMGYQFDQKDLFLQIFVGIPGYVSAARRILENGLMGRSFLTYESNIQFVLRFMIDLDIRGGGWIELPAGSYSVRSGDRNMSLCQMEVDTAFDSIRVHNELSGRWLALAPLRILSFDLECAGRKGHFPEAKHDAVIQIANQVTVQGASEPIVRNVFCLRSCNFIAGSQVIVFQQEKEMLRAWAKFVQAVDPDILTGYNIINFDLPYLLERAETLKLDEFSYLGRIRNSRVRMRDTTFNSKAYGKRESKEITIEGRIQFDLLPVIQREYKLRSYSLNAVSAHFLKQQKEDVHHSIITDLFDGNADTRRRLAIYCIKDAILPQKLLDKLMFIINYVEMARVTGVPINYLLTRGQQIKVVSQLYRKANSKDFLIPVRPKMDTDDQYEGATVIEPKKGFYTDPIATLDFTSLYPSIMMAHNLCYTTLVNQRVAQERLEPDQFTITPHKDCFVKASVRRGILPEILDELLSARRSAKKDLKSAKDPFLKAVLNGRQLALKISANSVYGFTGAVVGSLPCLEISSSVTAFGRQMIDLTKAKVEEEFCVKNGYAHDAEVIYGDTDSVMVKFGPLGVAESMELGEKAASVVSALFVKPINLEFEKVYYPYLLMNKKRYAGMLWSEPTKYSYMDAKGIETVRRDNCALVKDLIQTCLNKLLIDTDIEGALTYAKDMIGKLLTNRIDLSQLVITKSLGKSADSDDYKAKLAHVELAKRMAERDPGTAPHVGDRVAYVIVKGVKGEPQYKKAEDPIYVLEHGLPIDAQHYLDHQLKLPLERIFSPIIGDVNKLLSGDHTRSIKVSTSSVGALMKFAVVSEKCLGCKSVLNRGEHAVCSRCKDRESHIYMNQVAIVRKREIDFSKLWVQCQRCQDSLHQDVICSNCDCPIFYRRTKASKDLQEAQELLNKFAF